MQAVPDLRQRERMGMLGRILICGGDKLCKQTFCVYVCVRYDAESENHCRLNVLARLTWLLELLSLWSQRWTDAADLLLEVATCSESWG